MTPEEALTEGFQKWLEATITSETGAHVSWQRLDPYATSTRSAEFLVDGVVRVQSHTLHSSPGRAQQRLTDLGNAGLATGSLASPELTLLGQVAAAAWARHGILNLDPDDSKRYEFPRNVILIEAALERRGSST